MKMKKMKITIMTQTQYQAAMKHHKIYKIIQNKQQEKMGAIIRQLLFN